VDSGIKCGSHGARRARRSREHGASATVEAKSRNEASASRHQGARGENLSMLEAWCDEVVSCMRGLLV
jgi:hypothetical protein